MKFLMCWLGHQRLISKYITLYKYVVVLALYPNMSPSCHSLQVTGQDDNTLELSLGGGGHKVLVTGSPFRLDILSGQDLILSVNSRGLLYFEHLRARKDT